MRYNFIFILIIYSTFVSAQGLFKISGRLIDKDTRKELSFATLSIEHTSQAASTDEHGNFSFTFIRHPGDTLLFSLIGYKVREMPVEGLDVTDSLWVELTQKVYEISVIDIVGLSARETLQQAIKNMALNFPDSEQLAEGFFRQVHKEDNTFVRLIDARVVTMEQPYNYYQNNNVNEKVFIKALRRSKAYEENKEQHGDHLMDLLNENPFKFTLGTVLNIKGLGYFKFVFVESNLPNTFVIEFSSNPTTKEKIEKGTIWIDQGLMVINRLRIESFPNPNSKTDRFAPAGSPFLWTFRNGIYDVHFRPVSGHYLVDHIEKSYTHYLYDTKVNKLEHIVEETFELTFRKYFKKNNNHFSFTMKSNLYSQKYAYDEKDWVGFPVLPKEVLKDLERKLRIEEQYRKSGE